MDFESIFFESIYAGPDHNLFYNNPGKTLPASIPARLNLWIWAHPAHTPDRAIRSNSSCFQAYSACRRSA
jgi:hypothetical protein